MRLRSNESYSLVTNGIINSYPSLRSDISCDILVVGAGITGSLLTFQLCSEHYKTVLIDKRGIAMGSTSATTSLLQYELDKPLFSMIDMVGQHAAVDTYQQGVKAIQKLEGIIKSLNIDCDFERKESLYVARTAKDAQWLSAEFDCRKKFGLEVRWLTRSQLLSEFGVLGFGAILSRVGASLDAYRLSHFLLDYCVKHYGLEIYNDTELNKVEQKDEGNVIFTSEGNITCHRTLYTTGYETQFYLKEKIVDLVSTYAFISEPLPDIPTPIVNSLIWDTADPYFYMRTTSDKRILVGGGDVEFTNPNRRDALIDKKRIELQKIFNALIPDISIIPDLSWAGTFGLTKDALPYIGAHPDFPHSYFVLGFGGNGITFSVMGMEIISDALAGKPNKFLAYFRFNR